MLSPEKIAQIQSFLKTNIEAQPFHPDAVAPSYILPNELLYRANLAGIKNTKALSFMKLTLMNAPYYAQEKRLSLEGKKRLRVYLGVQFKALASGGPERLSDGVC